ncbi:MAG: hypothetical protein M0C28_22010 [Candidatus Moduliflexus flocculans]|nr:hypothetical protein [Candidatus Moduliflexus flocculans]
MELNVRQAALRAAVERAVRALESGDAEGSPGSLRRSPLPRSRQRGCPVSPWRWRTSSPACRWRTRRELRIALSGGAFLRYSPDDAARLLAHVLVRTKRYEEALGLASRPGLTADSDALYLRTRALRFLGDAEGFLAAVDSRTGPFPSDARIPRELLGFASALRARKR